MSGRLKPTTTCLFVLFAVCQFAGIRPISAQQSQAKDVHFQTSTKLIEIPLWVQDRQGEIVEDLAMDEISLFLNGKKIEGFRLIRHRPGESAVPLVAAAGGSSKMPTRRTATGTVLFAIDLFNTRSADLRRLKNGLIQYLKQQDELPLETGVIVLTPIGRIRWLSPPTRNRQNLLESIEKLQLTTGAYDNADWLKDVQELVEGLNSGGTIEERLRRARQVARSYAAESFNRAMATSGLLKNAASLAATFSKPRHLFYIGKGFSIYPGREYFRIIKESIEQETSGLLSDEFREIYSLIPQMQEMVDFAVGQDLFFSSFDPAGASAVYAGGDVVFRSKLARSTIDMAANSDDETTLVRQLASNTGGQIFRNRNNFTVVINEFEKRLHPNYTLMVEWSDDTTIDDAQWLVDIKIHRPFVKARYPGVKKVRGEVARAQDFISALLQTDIELGQGWNMEVTPYPVWRENGRWDLFFQVKVTTAEFFFEPKGRFWEDDLYWVVRIIGDRGEPVAIGEDIHFSIPRKKMDYLKRGIGSYTFYERIPWDCKNGRKLTVQSAFLEENSRVAGFHKLAVQIPDEQQSFPIVFANRKKPSGKYLFDGAGVKMDKLPLDCHDYRLVPTSDTNDALQDSMFFYVRSPRLDHRKPISVALFTNSDSLGQSTVGDEAAAAVYRNVLEIGDDCGQLITGTIPLSSLPAPGSFRAVIRNGDVSIASGVFTWRHIPDNPGSR